MNHTVAEALTQQAGRFWPAINKTHFSPRFALIVLIFRHDFFRRISWDRELIKSAVFVQVHGDFWWVILGRRGSQERVYNSSYTRNTSTKPARIVI